MRFVSFGVAGLVLLAALAARASTPKRDKAELPSPTTRIPTEPLEYHPSNNFYLMYRTSSASLDFIDSDHLLFTFRVTGLLKRLPECKPDDEDQLIRALVIHIPDGNVVRSAEWRLHDRGRYLWALGKGKFLVRQRDLLLTTDATLELQPYIQSTSPIRLVKLSPDASLLLIETDLEKHTGDEHEKLAEAAGMEDILGPREDVQVAILHPGDRSIVARSRALNPVDLPMLAEGSLESISGKGNHWLVRYLPFRGEPSVVADVESSCHPVLSPINRNTTFVTTCASGGEHAVLAANVSGKRLWNYRWDNHYIWPTITTSEDGRRIAFSTLRVAHPVSSFRPINEDGSDFEAQRVEVLDVDSGRLALTQFATPIVSAGQNYALSADGRRFAILRDNAVEIYDLPSPPAAETATAE